ncbi:MAG: tetraacyldisaccharide 4'-kinase [bacterium]|nr:tetraacyldisaccharide 4'-kinase [bacterium]
MTFERVWKKILRREGLSVWIPVAFLLWLVSLVYRLLFLVRKSFAKVSVKANSAVISVGNISVGGSGKSPMTAFLTSSLMKEGLRVGIVSSGYGRLSNQEIIDEGYQMMERSAEEIGDEVKLLSTLLPGAWFSVADSKAAAVIALDKKVELDLIIVDDGFQHFPLYRDLELVTFDAGVEQKQLRMFPYGVLREPVSSLSRADIIIITRSNFARDITQLTRRLKKVSPDSEIYQAQFQAGEIIGRERSLPVKYLEDKSVFLFAGIGNFEAMRKQVSAYCADLDYAWELSDHQEYDLRLLKKIRDRAATLGSDLILTTGKDWVKLGDFDFGREIYYLDQQLDLNPGEEKLIGDIINRLGLKGRAD